MKDTNHVCPICGQKYEYCDYCKQMLSMGITPWRSICDMIECYSIYMDIREIKAGRINDTIVEDLKTNIQTLKQKKVELRESIKDYIKTLALFEQTDENGYVTPTEIQIAPHDDISNYSRKKIRKNSE